MAVCLVLLIATASFLASCGRRVGGGGPSGKPATVPRLKPAAMTIVPGVHMLGGLAPSAAYAVETPDGLVLIDTGIDAEAGPLKAQLAELGLAAKPVRAILLTHAHGDHSGGAQHLREATGARVYAGKGDAAILRAGEPREAFFSTFDVPHASAHPTAVDVELVGGETIAVGDLRFQALATPGHTPGSTCYLLERGGLRILFSGDVIMSLLADTSADSTLQRPLGTYSAYLAPRYRGDAEAYLTSIRTLRAMPAPDLVLPGHPMMDPARSSPVMTPSRWQAMLDEGARDMERLIARYQADGADFLDGHPKPLLPDLFYLGDFHGVALYALRCGSRLVLIDAPGGPGLVDFLKARLAQLGLDPTPPAAVLLTSCDPEAIAGLGEVVAWSHCQIIAPAAGLEEARRACPAGAVVTSAADLTSLGWLDATPVPLAGRGLAPVAYRLKRAGKTVLISGRIPVKLNREATQALMADIAKSRQNFAAYLNALETLRTPRPDVWLLSSPTEGQNANLYDHEWDQVLTTNRRAVVSNPDLPR